MSGTINKQDLRRLYHQIKKRSDFKIPKEKILIGSTKLELPSYRQIRYALQKIRPRTIEFLTKAWNYLVQFQVWVARKMYKKLPKPFKRIVKKMGRIEAKMEKILFCVEPRLKRRYGRLIYPEGFKVKRIKEKKIDYLKDFVEYVKNGNADDEETEYIGKSNQFKISPLEGNQIKAS